MAISPEDKTFYQRIASMTGWAIADEFEIHYSGDSNPIPHGGYFYDARDWEAYGYANVVEFWYDGEHDRLVVQRWTINRPDDMESAWACIGAADDRKIRDNVHAQIDAVRSYRGMEADGTSYPDLMTFDLDAWAEWRVWRSVSGWLKALAD